MQPVSIIESAVVPLLYSDIDTDQIIPSSHLTSRTTDEFARALFARRRAEDPTFVLNRTDLSGRSILLAGRNFGCGSSREAAVWALQAGGFSAVIAPTFGEIFETNALKNGLLALRLPAVAHTELTALAAADPDVAVTVDLTNQTVTAGSLRAEFNIDPFYRGLLLDGIDELDYLLQLRPRIERYEASPQMNPDTANRIEERACTE